MSEWYIVVGGVEPEVEMTSVTSTRELRPIPKQLIQMTKDPSSLSVTYHIEEDRREKVYTVYSPTCTVCMYIYT